MTMPAAIFRCDASHETGFGHLVRCMALAEELAAIGFNITFVMREGPVGAGMAREKGYRVELAPKGADCGEWLCMAAEDADAVVFDTRDESGAACIDELRKRGSLIVDIDDPGDKRLRSDLAFYPPVPAAMRLGWEGFKGELQIGWDWVVLRREFAQRDLLFRPGQVQRILVTMGGSDPAGLTLRAVSDLRKIERDFEAVLALGPGFKGRDELEKRIDSRFRIECSPGDIGYLMKRTDLAIASFGVTAYELAALGVPAVFYGVSPAHAEAADFFETAGMAASLGFYERVPVEAASLRIRSLLENPMLLSKMRASAIGLIDGRGAQRIAALIAQRLGSRP